MMILAMIVALVYVHLIMRFTFGWFSLHKSFSTDSSSRQTTTFSVIVAARNEEGSINQCLEALTAQNYPKDLFEVVIVNDHSTDSTESVANSFIENYKAGLETDVHVMKNPALINNLNHSALSIRFLNATGEGKKSAITQAIKSATGKLILVTDADCIMSPGWIKSFAFSYEKSGARCISGPVKMIGNGIFSDFQSLEFLSLIGSGAGSISAGMPIMCNGANFCYEKDTFQAVGGFEGNDNYASGDDVFLMLKISKRYGPTAVTFLKDLNAIVITGAESNLPSFLKQRLRWVSKTPGYTDFGILLTALSVMLINIGILISFANGLITGNWQPFLIVSISKLIIDFTLLSAAAILMNQKRLLLYYLPLQLLMPFYVVFTAIAGLISTVTWKGRPVK